MTEEWKDVIGYEGLYLVSSKGQIKSLGRTTDRGSKGSVTYPEKLLTLFKDCRGYYHVNLVRDKRIRQKSVHRIVAEAFIPNPLKLPAVDHIDTDKSNNSVDNLRWCTAKENINNPLTHKKRVIVIDGRDAVSVARENGIRKSTFHNRLACGWSVRDACTLPKYTKYKGLRRFCMYRNYKDVRKRKRRKGL